MYTTDYLRMYNLFVCGSHQNNTVVLKDFNIYYKPVIFL